MELGGPVERERGVTLLTLSLTAGRGLQWATKCTCRKTKSKK